MKGICRIALIICLMLALSMTAAASEAEPDRYDTVGVSITFPQEFKETQGIIVPYMFGAIDDEHHVYALAFLYFGTPKDEAMGILYSEDPDPADVQALGKTRGTLGVLVSADIGLDDVLETYKEKLAFMIPVDYDAAQEVGNAGGYTFYVIPAVKDDAYGSVVGEVFAEEFQKLQADLPEVMKGADFYEPVDGVKQLIGQKIEFTAKDLDGNTVTSEELFSANEITMINCWGLWCPHCAAEMPELARIHTRMQEKGCGIVGLEWEGDAGEEKYQQARKSMEEWGTNYPNVLMPDELSAFVKSYPTSIFVDREGTVLRMPISGAAVNTYESALDALLTGVEAVQEAETETEELTSVPYRVNVSDEEGPVEGVMIQFCDESTCRFGETDEDGTVVFEVPAGKVYDVHVLDVPDGYMEDEEVYQTTGDSDEVNIVLEKE